MNRYVLVALIFIFCKASIAEDRELNAAVTKLAAMRIEPTVERLVQYAAQGDSTVVELLIQSGIPVSQGDSVRSVSALHNAAAQGHVKLTMRLIELGAPVNAIDWRGVTPVVAASFYCKAEVIKALIAAGADTNVRPTAGPTPLISAIYCGNIDIVALLLKAGADPKLADAYGNTPLSVALTTKRDDVAAILR